MSSKVRIELLDGKMVYAPGEAIEGVVSWQLREPPEELKLYLLYHTQGKGDEDATVVETVEFPGAGAAGVEPFHLTAPGGPFTFSGRLISLSWKLELVTARKDEVAQQEITLSTSGGEIRLAGVGRIERK